MRIQRKQRQPWQRPPWSEQLSWVAQRLLHRCRCWPASWQSVVHHCYRLQLQVRVTHMLPQVAEPLGQGRSVCQ
jgi:hypothetical protein